MMDSFAGKIIVSGAQSDLCIGGDVAHRRRIEAFVSEQPESAGQNILAGVLALSGRLILEHVQNVRLTRALCQVEL
jgi:hypothetical protein